MKIKDLYILVYKVLIIFDDDDIRLWDHFDKNREFYNGKIDYDSMYDYKIVDNNLIIADEFVFDIVQIYNESKILFYKKFNDDKYSPKLWKFHICNVDEGVPLLADVSFNGFERGLFYLQKFVDENNIKEIKTIEVFTDHVMLNDVRIPACLLYNNCNREKYNIKIYDPGYIIQPEIKSFIWLDDYNTFITFTNNERGIFNIKNVLTSERYRKSEIHHKLLNDVKYMHENVYSDDTGEFVIGSYDSDNYEMLTMGSEDAIYNDSILIDENGKVIKSY